MVDELCQRGQEHPLQLPHLKEGRDEVKQGVQGTWGGRAHTGTEMTVDIEHTTEQQLNNMRRSLPSPIKPSITHQTFYHPSNLPSPIKPSITHQTFHYPSPLLSHVISCHSSTPEENPTTFMHGRLFVAMYHCRKMMLQLRRHLHGWEKPVHNAP